MDTQQEIKAMFELAFAARQQAYAVYSNFLVGACLKSAQGELFAGCNIENASFSMTLCAEASALGSMITQGERNIAAILIVADSLKPCAPCGACRQRLSEFCQENTRVHLCDLQANCQTQLFSELFPQPFAKIWGSP